MKIFMKIEDIDSSNIKSISYMRNEESNSLVVDFVNGKSYLYNNVPFSTLAKIFTTDYSIGSAFHREIISANFTYKKL